MEKYKTDLIELMLESGVLRFGEFTLKSGRKSPYFINAGGYCTGAQMSKLGDFYADAIAGSGEEFDVMFGPAYKGIPLCVAASGSLWRRYGKDVPYSFNRKEAKDHGEGGVLVGYVPKSGERVAIIEDVTSAGTSVRETEELFKSLGIDVKITALFVSVDRMERGTGDKSALDELRERLGVSIYPIITARDIVTYLGNKGEDTTAIEGYLKEYGARN